MTFARATTLAYDLLDRGYTIEEAADEAAATYARTEDEREMFASDIEGLVERRMSMEPIEVDPWDTDDMEMGR